MTSNVLNIINIKKIRAFQPLTVIGITAFIGVETHFQIVNTIRPFIPYQITIIKDDTAIFLVYGKSVDCRIQAVKILGRFTPAFILPKGIRDAERIRLIEEYLGLTNIVVEIIEEREGRYARKGLTSSGVIVIRKIEEDKIITAFMASERQALHICKEAGKKCVPPKLWKKIQKNLEKYPELLYIVA